MSKEIHHIIWSTTKWLLWVKIQCRSLTRDSLARLLPSPFSPSILVLSLCRTLRVFFQGSLFLSLALLRSNPSLPPPITSLLLSLSLFLCFSLFILWLHTVKLYAKCNVYSLQLYTPNKIAWNDKEYIELGIKETPKSCTLLHTH